MMISKIEPITMNVIGLQEAAGFAVFKILHHRIANEVTCYDWSAFNTLFMKGSYDVSASAFEPTAQNKRKCKPGAFLDRVLQKDFFQARERLSKNRGILSAHRHKPRQFPQLATAKCPRHL